jgi:hypothetical protein
MRVYVGGSHRPYVIASSLEQAMKEVAEANSLPQKDDRDGSYYYTYGEQWTCQFADGDPTRLYCTMTVTDSSGTHEVYVQGMELEEAEDLEPDA